MSYKAHPARDPFRLSLGGVAAVNSYAMVPAIAADQVNLAWDERLQQVPEDQPDTIREIENFLGRYFAGGLLRAA